MKMIIICVLLTCNYKFSILNPHLMLSKLKSTLLIFLVTSNISFAQNWNLVWSDEFESNGAVNSEKWHHQTLLPNGYSWYNSELQHYTNRIETLLASHYPKREY